MMRTEILEKESPFRKLAKRAKLIFSSFPEGIPLFKMCEIIDFRPFLEGVPLLKCAKSLIFASFFRTVQGNNDLELIWSRQANLFAGQFQKKAFPAALIEVTTFIFCEIHKKFPSLCVNLVAELLHF